MEMMGAADRVADGMEQSWITAHVFQLTCLLTDVSKFHVIIAETDHK